MCSVEKVQKGQERESLSAPPRPIFFLKSDVPTSDIFWLVSVFESLIPSVYGSTVGPSTNYPTNMVGIAHWIGRDIFRSVLLNVGSSRTRCDLLPRATSPGRQESLVPGELYAPSILGSTA